MPWAYSWDTVPDNGMIRSSAGFELLAGRTTVGTPRTGIPRNTVSTNPRLVGVAYFML